MKIAFIGQKGLPATVGGVESHVERLALGLKKRGHDIFVYARPWYVKKQQKSWRGIKLIYKSSWKTKNLDAISHVFLASVDSLKRDFEIIHYHGVGPALMAWIPKLFKPSAKIIVTFHSIDRHHMKWGFVARFFLWVGEKFANWFAHETIVVSKTLQRYNKKAHSADTIYIPNGIDVPKQVTARVIKKKYGLQPNKYIFFMSRLVRHKGVHYLIDAFNGIDTDMKLVIAGGSAFTDDYVKEIKAQAKSNKNIIFTGSIERGAREWQELYSNAYVFALPSESEGLPIVVLEAMSFSRCVLGSNIPQISEAISGGFGYTFKNTQVNDLRKKLSFLIKHPSVVKKVGDASYHHVIDKYNWRDIVVAIENVYECLAQMESHSKIKQCIRRSTAKL